MYCCAGLAVAPDKSAVVSVGSEGGIFIWEYAQPESAADYGDLQQVQQLSLQ